MRWLRYRTEDGARYGIIEGDEVYEVRGGLFDAPERTGRRERLDLVAIEIPLIPRTFYTAGINYLAHAELQGLKLPEQPDVNYRGPSALTAHGSDVVVPKDCAGRVQYEGELVAVIGRTAKNLSVADALSCVFGYTIGNDISERVWQGIDRTLWRAKNSDTFKPMGPWIETEVDLDSLETVIRLNGTERARFKTNNMLFGIAEHLSRMSRYMTLCPGDILWMGTDLIPGDMVAGDDVEVEISGIGTLRNRIVAET